MRHWLRERGGWFGWLRGWWLERKVLRIAQALLGSFQSIELIDRDSPKVIVSTGRQDIRVRLVGVSCREESLFVIALREIFDPLQSPRYLLVTKDEEFTVPQHFAKGRTARSSARQWRRWSAVLAWCIHTPEASAAFCTRRTIPGVEAPSANWPRLLWG
jgi:hypothetical protein